MRPTVPPHVEAVVSKALEKVPADRFATAEAFARALGDPGFRYASPGEAEQGVPEDARRTLGTRGAGLRRYAPMAAMALVAAAALTAGIAAGKSIGVPFAAWLRGSGTAAEDGSPPPIRSLAVLPLESLSGDPDQE